jgi:hypothetical protein
MSQVLSLAGVPIAEISDSASDALLEIRRACVRAGLSNTVSIAIEGNEIDVTNRPPHPNLDMINRSLFIKRRAVVSIEIEFAI